MKTEIMLTVVVALCVAILLTCYRIDKAIGDHYNSAHLGGLTPSLTPSKSIIPWRFGWNVIHYPGNTFDTIRYYDTLTLVNDTVRYDQRLYNGTTPRKAKFR